MKWNRDIKSKFTVFVLCPEVEKGAGIKAALSLEGFDSYLFTDPELLYNRIKEAAPHVLVIVHGALAIPLEEFVQEVLNLSSEIRFVSIGPPSELNNILKFRPFNFSNMVFEGDGLFSRVAWSVDEVCQSLYLTYQNEHIYSLLEKEKSETIKVREEITNVERRVENSAGIPVQQEFKKYLECQNKDEVLALFLLELNQKFLARNKKVCAVYFKYLPSVSSFVALQALGIEIDSLKGVGCRLTTKESADPISFFASGGIPQELRALMNEGLGAPQGLLKPILVQNQVDGIFAIWAEQAEIFPEEIENDLALFALMYERTHLVKKLSGLDLADDVTELYGRHFYSKQLAEEVARARRLQKAVSVVKLAVDHLPELQQTLGKGGRDQILRSIAVMIQKTSRVNDVSCRTDENEFSLILPHCARKGASLRAERLRRMVEAYSQKWTGNRFTVSCGIGEYPSHCSTADDLEKAAAQALDFIVSKGGNKVCLFQPDESFRPDYEVPPL